jgi:hypothetical protein
MTVLLPERRKKTRALTLTKFGRAWLMTIAFEREVEVKDFIDQPSQFLDPDPDSGKTSLKVDFYMNNITLWR